MEPFIDEKAVDLQRAMRELRKQLEQLNRRREVQEAQAQALRKKIGNEIETVALQRTDQQADGRAHLASLRARYDALRRFAPKDKRKTTSEDQNSQTVED